MDQPNDKQPRGDIAAFMNRDKQPGDKRPAFEGHICKPGSDQKRPLALWSYEYTDPKTGEVKIRFSGRAGKTVDTVVTADMTPAQQLAALTKPVAQPQRSQADAATLALGTLTLTDDQVTLFPNGFKDEAPDANRPEYWGGYNPGDGSPIIRIGVWMKTDRNGRLYLAGATSYPLPGKSEAEQQVADAPTIESRPATARRFSMQTPPEPWPHPEPEASDATPTKAKRSGKAPSKADDAGRA